MLSNTAPRRQAPHKATHHKQRPAARPRQAARVGRRADAQAGRGIRMLGGSLHKRRETLRRRRVLNRATKTPNPTASLDAPRLAAALRLGGYGARPRERAPGTVGGSGQGPKPPSLNINVAPGVFGSRRFAPENASWPSINADARRRRHPFSDRNAAASSIRCPLKARIRPAWSSCVSPPRAWGGPVLMESSAGDGHRRTAGPNPAPSTGPGGANPSTEVSIRCPKHRCRRSEPEESRCPDRREESLRPGFGRPPRLPLRLPRLAVVESGVFSCSIPPIRSGSTGRPARAAGLHRSTKARHAGLAPYSSVI